MLRFLYLFFSLMLFSCTTRHVGYITSYDSTHSSDSEHSKRPDYTLLRYWAAHPWKKNPSDSAPDVLKDQPRDSLADVFFIYPTTYTGKRSGWNADIDDTSLNQHTDNTTILYQASVFNQHCRIFSPRYRQAHLSAFYQDNPETRAAFDTAYADIRNAFEFYLLHYHTNQPIIIAGHSQGAKMAERLLKEFFDGKPLQQQLVAAYIVGWAIPQQSFEHIPVCADSMQTGCFCGWRTLRKDYIPFYVAEEKSISYVTNPLSWTTSHDYIPATKNKGSVLTDFRKLVFHTTDAQIHEGVLWINRPHFPGSVFLRWKNYHIADINLFYMNLRANVEQRTRVFLSENRKM